MLPHSGGEPVIQRRQLTTLPLLKQATAALVIPHERFDRRQLRWRNTETECIDSVEPLLGTQLLATPHEISEISNCLLK